MAINRATFQITDGHLEQLVLEQADLPGEFSGHQMVREGLLDNRTMAEQGFPGNTENRFREAGRITGFLREFGPTTNMQNQDGFNFLGATVAHLFDDSDSVSTWMNEIFIKDFEQNVGERVGEDHQLVSVKRLETDGFYDEAVALKVLQGGPSGLVSSTVIDFRIGRLLGVAFVATIGDHERLELATELGIALEKRMVGVVLGG
jgi:hypothetical protein